MIMKDLIKMQNLTLENKIKLSQAKIIEWCHFYNWNIYVSFSGGKDSTVLLDLVCRVWEQFNKNNYLEVVFVNTGLEYPEIVSFVNMYIPFLEKKYDIKINLVILKPEKNFKEILNQEGYPVISKETALKLRQAKTLSKDSKSYVLRMTGFVSKTQKYSNLGKIPEKWKHLVDAPFKISEKCCDLMKKKPFTTYEKNTKKKPFIGTMASDSRTRLFKYLKSGCNSFESKPQSAPLGFWLENDVLKYCYEFKITLSKIYGVIQKEKEDIYKTSGVARTGCIFCMFGIHMEKGENRFQKMRKTHPKLYNYCIYNLNLKQVLDYINIKY